MIERNGRRCNSPLVSIVTPCYNGASYLDRYFEGLLSQTYENLELVFVNDGSTDGTERLFREYESIIETQFDGGVVYIYQENKGPCAAMNAGYQAASGQYIAPCDSDDVMMPRKVEAHIAAFERNPDCDLVYGKHLICDEAMQPIREMPKWKNPPSGSEVYEALLIHGMFIVSGSYCFRKECLQLLPGGKLNESYVAYNLQLLLRIGHAGRIAFHPDLTVCIIARENSSSSTVSLNTLAKMTFGAYKIRTDMIAELGCSQEVRRKAEARYVPKEMLYYFITQDKKGVRECFRKGLKLRLRHKRIYLLYLLHLIPWTWNWAIRKRYANYLS